MFSLCGQFCKTKFFNKLLEIVFFWVVSLFGCKPKWTFYVNNFYVNNVSCWKCVALTLFREGVRRYIYLPLRIFVIKSEPQQIFLKTFWLLILMKIKTWYKEFKVCFYMLCWRKVAIFTYFSKNCLKIRPKTKCIFA